MRRSNSMKSLNRERFHDDNMSRSFDAQSMGGHSMGAQSMGARSMGGGNQRGRAGDYPRQPDPRQQMRGNPRAQYPPGHPMNRNPDPGGHTYQNCQPEPQRNMMDPQVDPRGQIGRRSNRYVLFIY